MTAPHKATPEQWKHVEQRILAIDPGCSCLLELRDRLAAAEQRIQSLVDASPAKPDSSPARAGGLVERVGHALIRSYPGWENEAPAAILAVADFLEESSSPLTADWLREEVKRRG